MGKAAKKIAKTGSTKKPVVKDLSPRKAVKGGATSQSGKLEIPNLR